MPYLSTVHRCQGGTLVNDELFREPSESVREGGAILRGRAEPARTFAIDEPDVAALRREYGLSQDQFAALLGISVRTLQNWEQGRRSPQGPAKILLRVAARHPEAVLDSVAS
jgi:putative transcriptional regulator